jgi:cytochrome bd-type quinol oxidase subunit 1
MMLLFQVFLSVVIIVIIVIIIIIIIIIIVTLSLIQKSIGWRPKSENFQETKLSGSQTKSESENFQT